jgi:pimeloyl-ACP methyl ester carboxylesterase
MARSSWCRRVAALLIAGLLSGSGAAAAKPAGSVSGKAAATANAAAGGKTAPVSPASAAGSVGARRWETLPLPGPMPRPGQEGTFAADDVKLWFATFGEGPPVVLLHGGLGSSRHFSSLIAALVAKKRRVIAMDSRGHGRSTRSARGISYRQMADDVVALLDHLAIERAAIVGWSDGGATGLDVAIRYPERLGKLFVIGTNYAVAGTKKGGSKSKTFPEYFALCRREYAELSPDPKQLNGFLGELRAMWGSQPNYTAEQLASIAAPVVVALGEHDEVVRLDHVQQMVKHLGRGRLVVLPGVSHFAMWQDPAAFNAKVIEFLDEKPGEPGQPGRPGKVTPPPKPAKPAAASPTKPKAARAATTKPASRPKI